MYDYSAAETAVRIRWDLVSRGAGPVRHCRTPNSGAYQAPQNWRAEAPVNKTAPAVAVVLIAGFTIEEVWWWVK